MGTNRLDKKSSSYKHSEWGEGLMREWIDERCYQVGDAGAAIAGDEPEGDGGDQEDGRWSGILRIFLGFGIFLWL